MTANSGVGHRFCSPATRRPIRPMIRAWRPELLLVIGPFASPRALQQLHRCLELFRLTKHPNLLSTADEPGGSPPPVFILNTVNLFLAFLVRFYSFTPNVAPHETSRQPQADLAAELRPPHHRFELQEHDATIVNTGSFHRLRDEFDTTWTPLMIKRCF